MDYCTRRFNMKNLDSYVKGIENGAQNIRKLLMSRFSSLKNSVNLSQSSNEQVQDAILAQSQKDDECRIIIDLIRYLEEIKTSCLNALLIQTPQQQGTSVSDLNQTPTIKKMPADRTYEAFIEYISRLEFTIIRNGYNKEEVDTFLDRVCDSLDYFNDN